MISLLTHSIFSGGKKPLILTVDTTKAGSASTHFILPLNVVGSYDFIISWGDGTSNHITTWNDSNLDHTYSASGIYNVKVRGTCSYIYFNRSGDKLKVTDIKQWGDIVLSNCSQMFSGCSNLVGTYTDIPKTSTVTDFSEMFGGCSVFNGSLANWDVSSGTNFSKMFYQCTLFNKPLTGWDTLGATAMAEMFRACTAFNQPVNSLKVSNVTSLQGMFNGCTAFNQSVNSWIPTVNITLADTFASCTSFNQDISNLVISAVTSITRTVSNTSFNQPVSTWNVSNVTTAESAFSGCSTFNQNMGAWNVTKFTSFQTFLSGCAAFNNGGSVDINNWVLNTTANVNMLGMFANCSSFNQNLGLWNVTKVTTFNSMFQGATLFNNGGSSSINNWVLNTTLGAAINLGNMFRSSAFNQPLNLWNTSEVTLMNNMFQSNTVFNQDISGWNTAKVTNMASMFASAIDFNQNISVWNYSSITGPTGLTDFLNGTTSFPTAKYDLLLNALAGGTVNSGITLGASGKNYTIATSGASRTYLTTTKGWSINDSGGI